MKYVFVIQGEGRGHLTQAMSLERILLSEGHEVVCMLVGKSPERTLPAFFTEGVAADIIRFDSMNFSFAASRRKPDMFRTVLSNTFSLFRYVPSMRLIRDTISSSGADVVVNFYELMAGLAYTFFRIDVPMVSIGHQYMFLHKDFGLPFGKYTGSRMLNLFSRITSARSVKRLALSFFDCARDTKHGIVVVPPLLRKEILEAVPENGGYVLGYMLNEGFAEDVLDWHKDHPEEDLRFFWDRNDVENVTRVDETLVFYRLSDQEFVRQMAGCDAYASTAGFESVCEALYLGKPALLVPTHVEQEINAFDAERFGAGIRCDRFDLGLLRDFSKNYLPAESFRDWVRSAGDIIVEELEKL